MSPRATVDTPPRPFEVAIVGNDAVLAALPARPMQLAHAILACGYDLVVPVSWGEEVLAEHTLRAIAARGSAPAIFCACPTLRARLLSAGNELAPYLISVVSPAIATARYLRALQPGAPLRITMIGGCPSSRDDSIDTRIGAHDFLRLLVNRGVSLTRQPAVFDSVLPPDRRRHFSLPGGCPAPKALETRAPDRRLVTITDDAFSTELAELLLGGENVLIDVSPRLACTCCGGPPTGDHWGPSGRDEILALEPPRAPTPVIDLEIEVQVDVAPTDPSARPEPPEKGIHAGRGGRVTAETIRLPGASPIAEARARSEERGERRRIAITPPTAMPAFSPTAEAAIETAPAASAPVVAQAPSPTPTAPGAHTAGRSSSDDRVDDVGRRSSHRASEDRPLWDSRGAAPALADRVSESRTTRSVLPSPPGAPPSVRAPAATIARNPALSAPELHPNAVSAGTYAELGMLPSLERQAPPPVDSASSKEAPATSDAPVVEPVAVEPEVRAVPETPEVRPRRGTPQRFHLSRSSAHPRAQTGGKTLPRAYIRHTPVGVRAIGEAPVAESEIPLPVAVEPGTPLPGPEPPEALAPETLAPETLAPETLAPETLAPEAPAAVEPAPVAVAPVELPVLSPRSATLSDLMAGDEALAKLRQHAQRQRDTRPPRIVAREVPPPRPAYPLGSLLRFVAAVIVVMALIVVLAIVVLRAPTAPW